MKKLISALFTVLFLLNISLVNGQSSTNSSTITSLIIDKYNRGNEIPGLEQSEYFVRVVYESPSTVVLEGNLLKPAVEGYSFNPDLWSAMDLVKNQFGFKLSHVFTSDVGNDVNPILVYIVMTK